MNGTLELKFDHPEAAGKVMIRQEHFGVLVGVEHEGQQWGFLIDLFHLRKEREPDEVAGPQVVVYDPRALDGDPLCGVLVGGNGVLHLMGHREGKRVEIE